jgi:hypothetical protein
MSSAGAAPRAAVSVSSARAEASRRNGARSRGPKTPEGKARSVHHAAATRAPRASGAAATTAEVGWSCARRPAIEPETVRNYNDLVCGNPK